MHDPFTEAYRRLNTAQKEAVDTIEGPVLVIAGPGTGKTQILTLRIAHILRTTDTAPHNILALTFTEAGARAMRERLRTYIGSAAHKVAIHTFHEFAGTLIRTYPDAYARAVGGRPATDLEKVALIEDVLESSEIRLLRPRGNPEFYIAPLLGTIGMLKREYITPDALLSIIEAEEAKLAAMPKLHEKGAHKGKVRSEYQTLEKECAKNRELLFVYRAYDAALSERRLYDFEDMIFETVAALERNEDMLRDLQERFLYILADEHQDVNGSQNRILELLASFHERPNLFVVGDEKQAIFRFQGASLENFLFFEERFPHTKTIALTDNYRSAQNILDCAHALITEEDTPAAALRVPLTAQAVSSGVIEYREYAHEAIEDDALIKRIQAQATHLPRREIAVIVRSNKEVERYAHLLRSAGIPAEATADGDILRHPITASVRSLITAVTEPSNESVLTAVLHEPYWGIETPDLVRLMQARSFAQPLSALLAEQDALTSLGLTHPERCTRVAEVLTIIRSQVSILPPHRLIAALLKESGFVDQVMQHDPIEGGRVLRRLYDEIESLVAAHETATLADVVRMFRLRVAHNLPLSAPYIHTGEDAVQVMTAHKSKGLEFAAVHIPHLTSRSWGDTKKRSLFRIPITKKVDDAAFDALDDERKLLYVAQTRAKEGLYLSYAHESTDGRGQTRTPLLEEIVDAYTTSCSTDADVAAFNLAAVFSQPPRFTVDASFLRTALTERGLSATALNNYLRSPWTYLYRTLLRIPDVQSESQQFGTALHGVLASAFVAYRQNGAVPTLTDIKRLLDNELGKLPIGAAEYTRLHAHGMEVLVGYLDMCAQQMPPYTREEMRFEALLPLSSKSAVSQIRLTGTLDRLDFNASLEEGGSLLRVVDYKSGKPKTRGVIEGTTKDSDGDYKRQLVFYALLLSLQDDDRFKTRDFTLSFIEPDQNGKIHEESYTITDAEIGTLRDEIERVVNEITEGAFLSMACDPEKSDYCHLVSLRREH